MANTDRIVKSVVMTAPVSRVWRAISDAKEFGAWFGVELDAPFAPGARLVGRITGTQVDPEVAKLQEPHAGLRMELAVERIEPERAFAFRWHPGAVERGRDYSQEPTTLVTFELEAVPGGTKLTITESGFDGVPLERRAKAFEGNEAGWAIQIRLVETWVATR